MTLPIEIDASSLPPLGMPPQEFLRDYWQKRPLLIRNAFADFEAPLTPEDLAGLACEEAALSRLVQYDRGHDRWTVRQGPFAEEEFPALPEQDWTLLVQDVDKWDPDVHALLAAFDFLPRWRIDDVMISFAATGGSVGAHVDQYDVFLLQAHGHRRWQIDANPHPPTAFRDDVELKLLREFTATHDWVLAPGDMLYLPPGVPHHGVAEDPCLTFSIGMRAPSHAELIGDFADTLALQIPDAERYADPDLALPADPSDYDPSEIDDAALDRAIAVLERLRMDGRDPLRAWFGSFMTRYRSAGEIAPPPKPPSEKQIADRLARGAVVVAHPFARLAWCRSDDGALLFVNGDSRRCSIDGARMLCRPEPLTADAIGALADDDRALLVELIRSGHYVLSAAPRR